MLGASHHGELPISKRHGVTDQVVRAQHWLLGDFLRLVRGLGKLLNVGFPCTVLLGSPQVLRNFIFACDLINELLMSISKPTLFIVPEGGPRCEVAAFLVAELVVSSSSHLEDIIVHLLKDAVCIRTWHPLMVW